MRPVLIVRGTMIVRNFLDSGETSAILFRLSRVYGTFNLLPLLMDARDKEIVRGAMRQVAACAGVSAATVSRIISGSAYVSPEVQERVRKAALKLGIDLHPKRKSSIIAFVLSNRSILHPYHSRVLAGAEAYCTEQGYDMVFLTFHYRTNLPVKKIHPPQILERGSLCRGAILAGTNSNNFLTLLSERGLHFSVLGNNVVGGWQPDPYDVVWSDDVHGAIHMTRYLQSLGHRDIWFVGDCDLPWFARCAEGYRVAMVDAGLQARFNGIHSENPREIGYLTAKSILAQGEVVTAFFAGTDEVAMGIYDALGEVGLRVPGDVSVVGVSDIEAGMLHPALTSVREFPEQVGRYLAEMVINRLNSIEPLASQEFTVPTQIIKRESCAPAVVAAEMAR
jgi:DNA-binding LacI/PurR family transcriptional regulator